MSSTSETRPWVVSKFGGTSVASREAWETIERVARDRLDAGERPFIVCSAVAGMSDLLEGLLRTVADAQDPTDGIEAFAARHLAVGDELGIDVHDIVEQVSSDLRRRLVGARMVGEVSPRVHAWVMSRGELTSTRIGAAFLRQRGLPVQWLDAREVLRVDDTTADAPPEQHFLSATCARTDAKASEQLGRLRGDVVLTQGFLASNGDGDTVLLGRGGSDTSAAHFAARLGALRCEIWTDVPGLFSANPRHVPDARLVRAMGYDDAMMLATLGGKVLHPRCIPPAREAGIPLHVRCTRMPRHTGSVVCDAEVTPLPGHVSAVTSRAGLMSVSVERPARWQEVGVIAGFASSFANNDVSIDLLATSPSRIVAVLDPAATPGLDDRLAAVLRDLDGFTDVRIDRDVGSVSLVGHQLRSRLHQLGGLLAVFEDTDVRLISPAADDYHVTFVVPGAAVAGLVKRLHATLFASARSETVDALFGETWQSLHADVDTSEPARSSA